MIDVNIYSIPFFFASAALLGYLFRWWYRDFYLTKKQVSGLSLTLPSVSGDELGANANSSPVADQAGMVQQLQVENDDLRKQIADMQSANKVMLEKVQAYTDRKEQYDILNVKIEELEEEKYAIQQTNENLTNTVRSLELQYRDLQEKVNKKNKENADHMISFEMSLAEKIKENDILKQHNLELEGELNKLKTEHKSSVNNNLLQGIGRLEDPVANLSGNVKVQMNRLQQGDKKEKQPVVHRTNRQPDLKVAGEVLGTKVKWNDLKLIEGIGPKIEELFYKAGIKTWQELAETTVERCREILQAGGERFQMHNPGTWPRQSKMLASGKWKQLKEFQMSI